MIMRTLSSVRWDIEISLGARACGAACHLLPPSVVKFVRFEGVCLVLAVCLHRGVVLLRRGSGRKGEGSCIAFEPLVLTFERAGKL